MLSTPTKARQIFGELRKEILSGKRPLGEKLPTDRELAKRFGCSMATASSAISLLAHEGFVERRPRAGTRVIYNPHAETSPSRCLDAVAFIYPSEEHEAIDRTVKGFQDAARPLKKRVITLTTGTDYKKESEYIARLSEFDVRGAVVFPILPTPGDQLQFSQLVMASKFPVVLADVSLPGLGFSSVVLDAFHAGYSMTRHLIDLGLRRIGFFSNYAWLPSMKDRYLGYQWALNEAGLKEDADLVFLEPSMHPDFSDPLREPTKLASAYLNRVKNIDGVVCADDFLAQGIIDAASPLGIQIPKDLKVTGIGDYGLSQSKLTTYRAPYELIGQRAFDLLNSILSTESKAPHDLRIRGELVIRNSTH